MKTSSTDQTVTQTDPQLVGPFVDPGIVQIRVVGCDLREYSLRSTRHGNEYKLRLQIDPNTSCELRWRVLADVYLNSMTADSLTADLDSPDNSLEPSGQGKWEDADGNTTSALVYFTPAGGTSMGQGLTPRNRDFQLRLRSNKDYPVVTLISMGFTIPVEMDSPPN
ncbi:MAG: hypothetical protein HQ488_04010 [Parcubacteria group bacterium]|nr:hypothetical protein [Parcubacteria group bacterium]